MRTTSPISIPAMNATVCRRTPQMASRLAPTQLCSLCTSPTSMTKARVPGAMRLSTRAPVSPRYLLLCDERADHADITFVEVQDFTYQVPCFNATTGDFDLPSDDEDEDGSTGSSPSSDSSSASSTPSSSSSGGGGLSGGAIAGIVVGVIAGLALLGAGVFFIWRLRNQRERLRAQEASVRAVKWEERPSTTPSEQEGDVALRDMSNRA